MYFDASWKEEKNPDALWQIGMMHEKGIYYHSKDPRRAFKNLYLWQIIIDTTE